MILMLITCVMIVSGCAAHDDMVLTFNVSEPVSNEVVMVYHDAVRTFSLDVDGTAVAVLDGMDAVYARVFYGREFKWIYLERGDRASVSFNGGDFSGSFVFEGEKAQAVGYLNSVKLTPLPDEDFALPFQEYRERIEKKETEALKLMKANDLDGAGDFVRMEEGRIRYAYGASLLMYPVGHMVMSGDMSYRPDEEYYNVIDSYMVEDPMWVDLDEYRGFIAEASHALDEENRGVSSLYPKTVAQMRYVADRFPEGKVRENILHFMAAPYVEQFGTDGIQELVNIYRTYVKDARLVADFETRYAKWDLSRPGNLSPDFEAEDIDGRVWTLADFKGKYVYIDLWATWCGPCRREFPYLKELEAGFADAPIAFVGLSVDGDKAKWEQMVHGGTLTGTQLYLGPGSQFQKAYRVEGIPRFILLDKEGRIISNDMSRPSSEDTRVFLSKLQ